MQASQPSTSGAEPSTVGTGSTSAPITLDRPEPETSINIGVERLEPNRWAFSYQVRTDNPQFKELANKTIPTILQFAADYRQIIPKFYKKDEDERAMSRALKKGLESTACFQMETNATGNGGRELGLPFTLGTYFDVDVHPTTHAHKVSPSGTDSMLEGTEKCLILEGRDPKGIAAKCEKLRFRCYDASTIERDSSLNSWAKYKAVGEVDRTNDLIDAGGYKSSERQAYMALNATFNTSRAG